MKIMKKRSIRLALIISTIFILLILGVVGFFIYQNKQSANRAVIPKTEPTTTPLLPKIKLTPTPISNKGSGECYEMETILNI